jgi:hypothetical protein
VKKLDLRPYHGMIWLCTTEELHKAYKRLCKSPYPYQDPKDGGRYVKVTYDIPAQTIWLVWASDFAYLAHEFSHVLLQTFGTVGHDPTVGDGEPFCYMLSQLLLEARA